jgi:hypothetical protein
MQAAHCICLDGPLPAPIPVHAPNSNPDPDPNPNSNPDPDPNPNSNPPMPLPPLPCPQVAHSPYTGIWHCLQRVLQTEGPSAFFKSYRYD